MSEITVNGMKTRVLISKEEIAKRVEELGKQITKDIPNENLVMVGVLTGSFLFMADLVRAIDHDLEVAFMQISSYGNGMKSTGRITIKQDVSADISGKDVIIVEDIVDSGRSLRFMIDYLKLKHPNSIKTVALLDKPNAHKVDISCDYVGFEISNEFVLGYGLDVAQKRRNLSEVLQVIPD
jgi:hypoxanthine phosphoribosyltransferase